MTAMMAAYDGQIDSSCSTPEFLIRLLPLIAQHVKAAKLGQLTGVVADPTSILFPHVGQDLEEKEEKTDIEQNNGRDQSDGHSDSFLHALKQHGGAPATIDDLGTL